MNSINLTQLIVAEAEGLLHTLIFEQDPELFGHYDYELSELLADKAAIVIGIKIQDLECIGEVSYAIDLCRHHSDDLTMSKRERAIYDSFFATCISQATGEAEKRKINTSVVGSVTKWFSASQKERDVGAVFHCCQRLMDQDRHGRNPLVILRVAHQRYFFTLFPPMDRNEARSEFGKLGAEALHGKPGGSRRKNIQIREIWESGKYSARDICAEQESAALEMSFSTARKALRNTPDPDPWPAKEKTSKTSRC